MFIRTLVKTLSINYLNLNLIFYFKGKKNFLHKYVPKQKDASY